MRRISIIIPIILCSIVQAVAQASEDAPNPRQVSAYLNRVYNLGFKWVNEPWTRDDSHYVVRRKELLEKMKATKDASDLWLVARQQNLKDPKNPSKAFDLACLTYFGARLSNTFNSRRIPPSDQAIDDVIVSLAKVPSQNMRSFTRIRYDLTSLSNSNPNLVTVIDRLARTETDKIKIDGYNWSKMCLLHSTNEIESLKQALEIAEKLKSSHYSKWMVYYKIGESYVRLWEETKQISYRKKAAVALKESLVSAPESQKKAIQVMLDYASGKKVKFIPPVSFTATK